MKLSGKLHAPTALPPRERALGTNWIGGWVGSKAGLDTRKIPSSRWDSSRDYPNVQPVVSRYTDWAIPALSMQEDMFKLLSIFN
jgi:hypothetical protein